VAPGPARPPAQTPPSFEAPAADASHSGQEDTIPAAMLDGDVTTAWSNFYVAEATALLPDISLAHEREWVSLRWPEARSVDRVSASFVVDEAHALPAAIEASAWDGSRWVPVTGLQVEPGAPTTITFDRVSTTMLRLDLTSAAPRTGRGFLAIAELSPGGG
jgi:beta-galactosidase